MPTFREAQTGLWERYDPLELATPEAFARDPELVWRWYRWRRELIDNVAPNPAHHALATLATLVPRLTLVTQNVDGLHQRAGSDDVIEFHGNLFSKPLPYRAARSHCRRQFGAHLSGLPRPVRPGVVWFGEAIPESALNASFAAAADCEVFLSVGTSSLVYPAAGLADIAREADAITVEVNPNNTEQSDNFDIAVRGEAGSVLPKLIESLAH